MLLEWYRRRDAKMDAHLKEYLFTTGSLIALEQAGAGGDEGGDASGERRLARHRQPEGGTEPMNNLKRELAPISTAAWKEIDDEATPRPQAEARRPEARRLRRPARPDRGGGEHRAPRAAEQRAGRRRRGDPAAGAAPDRAALVLRAVARGDGRRRARRGGPGAPAADRRRHAASPMPRTPRSSTATRRAASRASSRRPSHPILPIPDDYQEYPHSIAEATRLLRLAGVDGPVRHRPRAALLHRPHPGGGRRRLSRAERRPEAGRRPARLGARGQRRGGAEPPRAATSS